MKLCLRAALKQAAFIALSFSFYAASAQQSVQFESLTFDQAMAKAQKAGKIIFVDVRNNNPYPANAQVEKEVFVIDSVASFFKKNCVSIKMNMSTEEGKKFAPRLAMLMYPAYVFYDAQGAQLDFTNAGTVLKDPAVLMIKSRSSLNTAKVKMANKRSINFTEDTWSNLLAKAKKENKLIFFDAYTAWCRPCIQMAKDVFTLDKVADYYNKNFVNAGMDMEKGEGPALAKKYQVKAYPSFLFIDGDGNLVSQDGGYQEADKFIKAGETAVAKFAASKGSVQAAFIRPAGQAAPAAESGASAFIRPMALAKPGTSVPAAASAPEKVTAPAIHFSDSSWARLLAEAKASGKLIFVDAYTTWCGPCKMMRATVFTDERVGKLHNRNFVNAYIDMEKGEGLELRKKYEVRAYPTFLYINGDGEVVHRTVGSCKAEEFMQHSLDALSPVHNLRYLDMSYAANAANASFVKDYLQALSVAYEQKKADNIATRYLNSLSPATWIKEENWMLIKEYVNDAVSPVFTYVVNHQDEFAAQFGKSEVEHKVYFTYSAWPVSYFTFKKDEKPVFDSIGFNQYIGLLSAGNYSRKAELIAKAKLTASMHLKETAQYVKGVNNMLAAGLVPKSATGAEELYGYAVNVQRMAPEDKSALKQAAEWVRISSEETEGVAAADKITYMEIYADLLEKSGQAKTAKTVREKLAVEKQNHPKGNSVPMMRMVSK